MLGSFLHRLVLAAFVYITDGAQLAGALFVVRPWTREKCNDASNCEPSHLCVTSALIFALGLVVFYMLQVGSANTDEEGRHGREKDWQGRRRTTGKEALGIRAVSPSLSSDAPALSSLCSPSACSRALFACAQRVGESLIARNDAIEADAALPLQITTEVVQSTAISETASNEPYNAKRRPSSDVAPPAAAPSEVELGLRKSSATSEI